ncbi:MAG: gliding motility-associated C-terminal domain-containing protein [Bacteroidota bacterium]|nr:gliding motility-associated C-terminal domain-containing protein [Bacteroidota bacterium]
MKSLLLYKALVIVLLIGNYFTNAQNNNNFYLLKNQAKYIFNSDSLHGFEQDAAERAALSEGYFGDEFKVRMYQYKRDYIKSKYHFKEPSTSKFFEASLFARAASCSNEDFEASSAAIITFSTQIAGWTVTSGNNALPNNACNIGGCCPGQPVDCELIQCPTTGYLDPVIGSCYPIFSVFGNTNNSGNTFNPGLPQMKGSNIIRINNNFPQSGIARLSKTINVTTSNALFQFAYIAVLSPGHPCCGSTAFFIKCTNLTTNSILACPSASIYSPAPGCNSVSPATQYYLAGGLCGLNPSNNNNQSIFNKWTLGSLDLTSYLGNNINIEITVTDCATGAHFGYAYFDSQCSPLEIMGNNILYPLSTPSIVLNSCAPNSNTVIAPPDVGPYTWTCTAISIPPNLSTPSHTNTTLISNQSGTVALIMSPPGICNPIVKVITLSVSATPVANIQVTQPSCTNSVATVSLTVNSSITISPSIIWNPPGTISSNSLTNSNAPVGTGSVTVQFIPGCNTVVSYTINSSPSNPILNTSTIIPTKCGNSIGSIVLNVLPTTTTFSWSPNVSNTYSAANLAEGIYTITVFNQTCFTQTIISIEATDKATVINTTVNESRCDAATGAATITALNSNGIYDWTPPVSSSSVISNVAAGDYTVIIGNAGCGTTYLVNIPAPPRPSKIDLMLQDVLCGKQNGAITITNVYGGTPPYVYSIDNSNYSTLTLFDSLLAGNHTLMIKDAKGCTFFQPATIKKINRKTDLYYKIHVAGDCDELYEVVIDSIAGGKPPYYLSINNSPLFFSDTIKGLIEPQNSIKIYDADNCITDYIINHTGSKSAPLVYIPNSFTPNSDGINDAWFPHIGCAFEYNCLIFDRWGILIKELNGTENRWDGILKGEPLPIGVYCYIIDITGFNRKSTRLTGHINLIK